MGQNSTTPKRSSKLLQLILVLVLLTTGLGLGFAATRFALANHRGAEREQDLDSSSAELPQNRQDIDGLHAELDAYFGGIIANLDQQFIPLDRSARISLRTGQKICERIVRGTDSPLRRASAYCTLGHINSYRHDLKAAIDSYRKAVEAVPSEPESQTVQVRSYAANHLAGALAQLGCEEEALKLCEQVRDQIEHQISKSSAAPYDLVDELAFATRNQAVLLASNGELTRSAEMAQYHVSILSDLLTAEPTELTLAERLIDAKYLLAGLLWRCDAPSGKAESIQLLGEVRDAAFALRQDAERRMRAGESFDYGKYKSASLRSSQELALAQSPVDKPQEQLRNPSFWTRKNLYRGRRSIGTEILLDEVRMPAEFEQQEAMIVKWTGREWLDATSVSLVKELTTQLKVFLLVDDYDSEAEAREQLTGLGIDPAQVRFYHVPANTLWVRDFGPISVQGSEGFPIWIDYQHPLPETRSNNDQLIERLGRFTGHRVVRGPLLLEGGNLLSNGAGLVISTKQMEDDNLKLGFTPTQFRKRLKSLFGGQQIVVLDNLRREATGHVDWFLTFVSSDTVVIGEYDRITDAENAAILDANAETLRHVRIGANRERLKVVRIPMPPHPSDVDGFGGTYTNVVFANGKLLVPQWSNAGATMNAKAIQIYQALLPDWNIVPIDCTTMLSNHGALHCATSNVAKMPVQINVE